MTRLLGETPRGAIPSRHRARYLGKIAAFVAAMVLVVVVPFLLLGDQIAHLTPSLWNGDQPRPLVAAGGFLLLAADVVLPVPSTVVIAAMGQLLGSLRATMIAAGGLTLGCIIGYWLGRVLGSDFACRAMGEEDFSALAKLLDRYGVVVLAACRPVPVLAEVSVIAAGVAEISAYKVLFVTTFANIGFAAIYAALGANAESMTGFLLAVAAALGMPLAAMLLAKAWRARM